MELTTARSETIDRDMVMLCAVFGMVARSDRLVRIGRLADGLGEPDLADAIAIQLQFRKSLGRKPPIQDACLPFRP